MNLEFLIPIGIVVAIIVFILCMCKSCYKVAPIDKALIITGGKEPKIIVSGGSFVVPIFRKVSYFDLCMLTVSTAKDKVKTGTSVEITIDWTAQIRPDTRDINTLKKAIISFKERGVEELKSDVQKTLIGAVRDIVTSMTPEDVLSNKQAFTDKIVKIVTDEMSNMGMELVSLNIADISDENGYYDNIAALDAGDKRRAAENKKAEIDQDVRSKKAEAERFASEKELESELAIAEKNKDNNLKVAEFKAVTDKANADADIAGELQRTVRQQEVAEQQGRIEVIKQEQANLAAQKEKDVIATRAEADKQKKQIDAEASANVRKIDAQADVEVARQKANATKIEADAQAEKIRKEGQAEADVLKQKGEAEAAREQAILLAKAEGERKLGEARAANDKVNYEIEKLKIETNARVEIATKTATIMADLGKNAEFVNIGGQATGKGAQTGNVLIDTLMNIPALMKTLNAENEALNGKSFNDELNNLVSSAVGPIKGIFASNVANNESAPVALDEPEVDTYVEPETDESLVETLDSEESVEE